MRKKRVCIRGFVAGNLGDDLFFITLCHRYPGTQFVLCGEKKYKHLFESVKNLRYVSTDEWYLSILIRLLKLPAWSLNHILQACHIRYRFPVFDYFTMISQNSTVNLLLSGSLFIESPDGANINDPYYRRERAYYRNRPYVIGCNFGPYYTNRYYEFYQRCFHLARQVSFRDHWSAELFPYDHVSWAPDVLFTYEKEDALLPQEKGYVLICVADLLKDQHKNADKKELRNRQINYENALVQLMISKLKLKKEVVLMGFCRSQGDHVVIDRLMEAVNKEYKVTPGSIRTVIYPDITYRQAVGLCAGAGLIVATRFHAMILGWLYGKRVIPIVYSSKMLHVIEDLNESIDYVTTEELEQQPEKLCQIMQEGRVGELHSKQHTRQHTEQHTELHTELHMDKITAEAQRHFIMLDQLLS